MSALVNYESSDESTTDGPVWTAEYLFSFEPEKPVRPTSPPRIVVQPARNVAMHVSESFCAARTPKHRDYGVTAADLEQRGISVQRVDVKHDLINEASVERAHEESKRTAQNPIQQHLPASVKLSIRSLANKAITNAEALESVFAADKAKKRSAAARYGF